MSTMLRWSEGAVLGRAGQFGLIPGIREPWPLSVGLLYCTCLCFMLVAVLVMVCLYMAKHANGLSLCLLPRPTSCTVPYGCRFMHKCCKIEQQAIVSSINTSEAWFNVDGL